MELARQNPLLTFSFGPKGRIWQARLPAPCDVNLDYKRNTGHTDYLILFGNHKLTGTLKAKVDRQVKGGNLYLKTDSMAAAQALALAARHVWILHVQENELFDVANFTDPESGISVEWVYNAPDRMFEGTVMQGEGERAKVLDMLHLKFNEEDAEDILIMSGLGRHGADNPLLERTEDYFNKVYTEGLLAQRAFEDAYRNSSEDKIWMKGLNPVFDWGRGYSAGVAYLPTTHQYRVIVMKGSHMKGQDIKAIEQPNGQSVALQDEQNIKKTADDLADQLARMDRSRPPRYKGFKGPNLT